MVRLEYLVISDKLLFMEMIKEIAIEMFNNQLFYCGHVNSEIFMRQLGERDLKEDS